MQIGQRIWLKSLMALGLTIVVASCGDLEIITSDDQNTEATSDKKLMEFDLASSEEEEVVKSSSVKISGTDVAVTFSKNIALTNLVATFKLSDKAIAQVGDVIQESGKTENDFTEPVTYTIVAEDKSQQKYQITVTSEPVSEQELDPAAPSQDVQPSSSPDQDVQPSAPSQNAGISDSFVDPRDGKVYPIAELDGKIWMLKNFEYEHEDGVKSVKPVVPRMDYDEGGNLVILNEEPAVGRAYTFEGAEEAAPEGWRLPSRAEWESLFNRYGQDLLKKDGETKFNIIHGPFASCNQVCTAGDAFYWADGQHNVALTKDRLIAGRFQLSDNWFFVVRYVRDSL